MVLLREKMDVETHFSAMGFMAAGIQACCSWSTIIFYMSKLIIV